MQHADKKPTALVVLSESKLHFIMTVAMTKTKQNNPRIKTDKLKSNREEK